MPKLSITESPNELTTDIDVASPLEIVRLLRDCDAQMFTGYRSYPKMGDDDIVERLVKVTSWAASVMGDSQSAVIVSGAGTSGRLAMFACRTANLHLMKSGRSPNCFYRIAGGDPALIRAQEKAEDNPKQAWKDLQPLIAGKKLVLYIGVTCALAAPYVASQLWHLSRKSNARCVLIGFNPTDRASRLEVEGWDKTFADVVEFISPKRNCVILNPVIGPEAITGSTRMKGGSATKMLLEIILTLGRSLDLASGVPRSDPVLCDAVRDAFRSFNLARMLAYNQEADIARLIELGGTALKHGGHIYYVGADDPGILGIIDASECPPTFGADFEDVRGFIKNGWKTLLGVGHDLSHLGSSYRISLDHFIRDHLPNMDRNDLVVCLPSKRAHILSQLIHRCRRSGAKTAVIAPFSVDGRSEVFDVCVSIPGLSPKPKNTLMLGELATKFVLNSLTTGAHILRGKVYQNRMVDLRISNNKLYHRSIRIIQNLTGVSESTARRCLLRSLYGMDHPSAQIMSAKPSAHIDAAKNVSKIVPRALILAGARATCAQANRLLRKQPIVRTVLRSLTQP